MNRSHPNFGNKTKIGEREWWRRLIRGAFSCDDRWFFYGHKTRNEKLFVEFLLR